MLHRADNVQLIHKTGLFSGRGLCHLQIGREIHVVGARIHKVEFTETILESQNYPYGIRVMTRNGLRNYWLFRNKWYWENDDLDQDQVYALLVTKAQREEARIKRAQAIVAIPDLPLPSRRETIPEDTRQLIWIRDEGRCQSCGSKIELQFDHIIPLSLGGSTNPENLQILCGPCNRRKGSNLA